MASVITFPKVHAAFYSNPSVQGMLKVGFALSDVLEVHGEFFSELAGKGEDKDASIGEQTTQARLQQIFMSVLKRKQDSLTDIEWEENERRAEFFERIPSEKLQGMTGAEWEEAIRLSEAA